MIIEVDTSVLSTDYAETYFTERADRRIMSGLRATLEMLGIALPDWAERRPTGRKPGRSIAAAFRADNPETLHEATMRKFADYTARFPAKNETPSPPPSISERIATLKASQAPVSACADGEDPLAFLAP